MTETFKKLMLRRLMPWSCAVMAVVNLLVAIGVLPASTLGTVITADIRLFCAWFTAFWGWLLAARLVAIIEG